MSVPQSVATILKDHVTLEVESFDRLYLNVYVPTLQRVPGGQEGAFALEVRGPATTAAFGINDSPNWVGSTGAAGSTLDVQVLDYIPATTGEVFQVDSIGIRVVP